MRCMLPPAGKCIGAIPCVTITTLIFISDLNILKGLIYSIMSSCMDAIDSTVYCEHQNEASMSSLRKPTDYNAYSLQTCCLHDIKYLQQKVMQYDVCPPGGMPKPALIL